VQEADGQFTVVRDDAFRKAYEPVDGT